PRRRAGRAIRADARPGLAAASARPRKRRDPFDRLGNGLSAGLSLARSPGSRLEGAPAARRRRGRRSAPPLRDRLAGAAPAQVDVHPRRRGRRTGYRRAPGTIALASRSLTPASRDGRTTGLEAFAPGYNARRDLRQGALADACCRPSAGPLSRE